MNRTRRYKSYRNANLGSVILIVDLGLDSPQACQPFMLAAVRSKGLFRGPTILSNLSAICVNDKTTGLELRKAKERVILTAGIVTN